MKVALRNLWKYKTFSFINIAGLAIGLCCFLLITMFVIDEWSFDGHHKKASRIYRINSDIVFGGEAMRMPVTSDMMGAVLKKDYPEVEAYARIYNSNGNKMVRKGAGFVNEGNIAHVDSTFFDLFTVQPLRGTVATSLHEPNTVVLTRSAANKYLGTIEALGQTIETDDNGKTLYKVTAVIEDFPTNGHFDFSMLFSMKNVDYNWGQYVSHNFHTYVLLKEGVTPGVLQAKFRDYINRYVVPQASQYMQIKSMEDFEKAGNKLEYSLMPLRDIHLRSNRNFEFKPSGNIQYVYIFSAVALFILIIACINFMNLTTARSANRAREVGIRKVLGTERKGLIIQFLTESTLMAFISLAFALLLAYLVLPLFNDLATKQMQLSVLFQPLFLPLLLVLPFLVGLLAGSYPAFYLSSFRPIQVLKGKFRAGGRSVSLRSILVVFQFATSIVLIIGTIIIYRQLDFIQTKNVGFNKDQVLIVDGAYTLDKNLDPFKNAVLQLPGISSGSFSSFLPVESSSRNDNTYSSEAVVTENTGFNMQTWYIDEDYLRTLGMNLMKGRNFSKDFGADSAAVIINEVTAKILGHGDPIGKKIYASRNDGGQTVPYTIIGVVKNFHYETLRKNVGALGFFLGRSTGHASFRMAAGADVKAILARVEGLWKSMTPGMPFDYRFLDESFDRMYRAEQRVGKIALVFAVLTIFIACLGLFGLASFIAEQRTKEIGIRKVLGASVQHIVQLLSKDFVRLVLLAFIIATPLAWYAMNQWLKDFAFRISIGWWAFVAAGAAALLIALATIAFQAVRAALTNPVKNLRTE